MKRKKKQSMPRMRTTLKSRLSIQYWLGDFMTKSDLQTFARAWLLKGGWFARGSEHDGRLGKAVMELVKTVEDQHHSGWSFGRTIQVFNLMILAYNQDVAARLRSKAPSPRQP